MDKKLNELSKREKTNNNPNSYSPRSKKKEGKLDIFDQPTRMSKPAKEMADSKK